MSRDEWTFEKLLSAIGAGEVIVDAPPSPPASGSPDDVYEAAQPPPFSTIRHKLTPEQNDALVAACDAYRTAHY